MLLMEIKRVMFKLEIDPFPNFLKSTETMKTDVEWVISKKNHPSIEKTQ
jgi:hypothetical protein